MRWLGAHMIGEAKFQHTAGKSIQICREIGFENEPFIQKDHFIFECE